MTESYLDFKGLPCPLPLVKLKKALVTQPEVAIFKVVATDKGVLKDLPAFCKTQNLFCEILADKSPFELTIHRT
ncbi:sulfurtransferase TusA family protein [Thiosulfativibrio zosterae]|uniref:UPF0033 domain-containing protein n=1 Tax=Thiosulfativibrio zosterae TaxID=2675053 RepID=A0A6F8PLL4_9GAMM|nr:hypothetical protein THMIRHAT_07000 [Thiosulfativibrio zosterae]